MVSSEVLFLLWILRSLSHSLIVHPVPSQNCNCSQVIALSLPSFLCFSIIFPSHLQLLFSNDQQWVSASKLNVSLFVSISVSQTFHPIPFLYCKCFLPITSEFLYQPPMLITLYSPTPSLPTNFPNSIYSFPFQPEASSCLPSSVAPPFSPYR